ncbi:MAG: hypothetical protein JW730_02585 [Anaerolineales bacterium]|nr:hypothetical protein [Anaerolineales bacterium]
MLQTQTVDVITPAVEATVMTFGYFYIVELGEQVRPRHHHVGINGECTCTLRRGCPAVDQVRKYLADGGKRTERPSFGFYPVHPARCPIKGCGAPVYYDASLSSHNRGAGWACSAGGKAHYWLHRGWITSMRQKLARQGKNV